MQLYALLDLGGPDQGKQSVICGGYAGVGGGNADGCCGSCGGGGGGGGGGDGGGVFDRGRVGSIGCMGYCLGSVYTLKFCY